jgi:DNA polymerase-1
VSTSIVWDVESDNLTREATQIHCIVIQDLETEEVKKYHDYWALPRDASLQEGVQRVVDSDIIIGHNIAGYDKDILARIGEAKWRDNQITVDTMLMSCILHPNMQKNGLEAWAVKLGLDEQKVQNADWSVLTLNILNRCVSDVKINREVYLHLLREVKTLQGAHGDILDIGKALNLENKVSEIHTKQVLHGVFYDIKLAESLVVDWSSKMEALSSKIHKLAPKRLIRPYAGAVKKVYLKQTKKEEQEGSPLKFTQSVKSWCTESELLVTKGPFSRIRFDKINLNSGDQVKKFLSSIGWVPMEWNWKQDDTGNRVKTSPKLTEDSYGSLPEGLGQDVAHYNILKHRLSLLQNTEDPENKGSLPMARRCLDESTGLGNVPADAFTCGTPTARYRHKKPIANLPGAGAKYGLESRRIYLPAYGSMFVGVDLSGIEARMLSHLCFDYKGGREFAELVLKGDWHSVNAKLWGVTRGTAKIILYALMYGAGDGKLGKEAGGGVQRGKEIRAAFFESNPAYALLVEDLQSAMSSNGGWIPSMDGRPLYPRSKKDALNTKIQGDSAIVFKNWTIDCHDLEDRKKGYSNQLLSYHDELAWSYSEYNEEFNPECFGVKVCNQALATGERLGIKVPIAAEYLVGLNYASCH